MVPRLIVVSNRVAVPGTEAPRQAGGLAVAVNAALKQREGIWFGWSGRVAEDDPAPPPTVVERHEGQFPLPRPNGRCGGRKRSVATDDWRRLLSQAPNPRPLGRRTDIILAAPSPLAQPARLLATT